MHRAAHETTSQYPHLYSAALVSHLETDLTLWSSDAAETDSFSHVLKSLILISLIFFFPMTNERKAEWCKCQELVKIKRWTADNDRERLRGCEAGGLQRLRRVTAWPWARGGGQRPRCDTGDSGGTRSPFVTPVQPSTLKTDASLTSLQLSPLSKNKNKKNKKPFSPRTGKEKKGKQSYKKIKTNVKKAHFTVSLPVYPDVFFSRFFFTLLTWSVCYSEPLCPLHPQSSPSFSDLSILYSFFFLLLCFSLLDLISTRPPRPHPLCPLFLSPSTITLDIYSTAISRRRDENRFSLQHLLPSG